MSNCPHRRPNSIYRESSDHRQTREPNSATQSLNTYLCFPSSIRTSASMPHLLRLHRMEKTVSPFSSFESGWKKAGRVALQAFVQSQSAQSVALASNYPYAFNPLGVGDTNVHCTFAARNLGPGCSVPGPLSIGTERRRRVPEGLSCRGNRTRRGSSQMNGETNVP